MSERNLRAGGSAVTKPFSDGTYSKMASRLPKKSPTGSARVVVPEFWIAAPLKLVCAHASRVISFIGVSIKEKIYE